MNKIDELIAFHLRAVESCEAFAVTPDADKAKNKDLAKHYQKTAAWHREAVEVLRVSAALQVEKSLGIERLPVEPKPRGGTNSTADPVRVLQARRIDSFSGWRDVDATTFAQFEKCELTETRVLYAAPPSSAPKPPPTIPVTNHRDDQSALALVLQEELDRPRGFTD